MNPAYVTAPAHVTACNLGPATVLVNYRSGKVHTLTGPAAAWWTQLSTSGDPSAPISLNQQSAQALLDQLLSAGLLVSTSDPRPWPCPIAGVPLSPSWGTQELVAGRTPLPRVGLNTLVTAATALLLVLAVRHLGRRGSGMARLTTLLRWANARTRRPASPEQACRAVNAVRRAGLLAPGRVACLEESAAAVLTLAASRLRVTWCHGVAGDPVRLHAWVETTSGDAIAEPASTARYATLLKIPEPL
jgi:hypothetical protein